VVAGYLARYPLGGHVLSILHYLVGLQRLGYDVVFVEDHGWPYSCFDPTNNTMTDDPSYGLARMQEWFDRCGLRRWCYVDGEGTYRGMSRDELGRVCRDADIMLSLWLVTWLDELADCRRRIFIDLDPGFTQFGMVRGQKSERGRASPFDFHEHFTYGTRIGQPDCPIPTHGLTWRPLRPPVAMPLVPCRLEPDATTFTTVMAWSTRDPVIYQGVEYGQKDIEFRKIQDLPTRIRRRFEIAIGGSKAPREQLTAAGWSLTEARIVTETPWTYLDYIAASRGEFSVAVNLEVKSRSGWFSDRTAAYLASGKPAVVQDTGFSESLPCGEGLFAFENVDDVTSSIEAIDADYQRHCAAARRIAETYFDSDEVLGAVVRLAEPQAV
jgi:hypothetical protein